MLISARADSQNSARAQNEASGTSGLPIWAARLSVPGFRSSVTRPFHAPRCLLQLVRASVRHPAVVTTPPAPYPCPLHAPSFPCTSPAPSAHYPRRLHTSVTTPVLCKSPAPSARRP